MRSQPFENVGGVHEPGGVDVCLRLCEGRVQSCAVGIVEPVPRIQGQQLQFGALGQVDRFVNNETPAAHTRLDRHGVSVTLDGPPNKRLHPSAAASP
jgi:hypothetical protein